MRNNNEDKAKDSILKSRFEMKIKQIYDKDRYNREKAHLISSFLWRRLSLPITFLLLKTKITANQVSILSLILGLLAATFYAFGDWKYLLIGSLLLFGYSVLDHVDGEIARLKNQTSEKGRLYDNYTGLIKDCFLILGLTYGYYNQVEQSYIWCLGFLILIFWILPSNLFCQMKVTIDKERFKTNINLSVDKKIFGIKQKTIFRLLFAGLSRGLLIIFLAAINQLSLLFILLIFIGIIHTIIISYLVFQKLL